MVRAKFYEIMSTFVKVIAYRKNSGLFFSVHGVCVLVNETTGLPHCFTLY